jgi:hypothetical protein
VGTDFLGRGGGVRGSSTICTRGLTTLGFLSLLPAGLPPLLFSTGAGAEFSGLSGVVGELSGVVGGVVGFSIYLPPRKSQSRVIVNEMLGMF